MPGVRWNGGGGVTVPEHPVRQRAYQCFNKGCGRPWFAYTAAPDTACPFCGSAAIVHHIVPQSDR